MLHELTIEMDEMTARGGTRRCRSRATEGWKGSDLEPGYSRLLFRLQLLIVRFEELPDFIGVVEQPYPLFFVKRHRKSAEAIE